MPAANPTLKGHKLVDLFGATGPPVPMVGMAFEPAWITEIKGLFPDLEIIRSAGRPHDEESVLNQVSDEEWKDATIIVTGKALPRPELVPKLRYVQLQTAGANYMLRHPSITNTTAELCTASGIHGLVCRYSRCNSSLTNVALPSQNGFWQHC